ncbi:PucR family transcriptional regulator [Streptosporangium sandarakinum]|uniref:PucR family transcriptional regulator n=1 Tax=Streptosporangium sandarakinum TaxID=1260955 RepID=UPI003673ABD7
MNNPVLSRLALARLADLEEVIVAWADKVMALSPYDQGLVPREEVEEGARIGFALILRRLAEGTTPPELVTHSERLGERRAGQGVPLASLLAAGRLDARALWQSLIDRAGPGDLPELLGGAHLVWEAVERHVTGLMAGYQRAVLEMGRQREDQRRAWFARLLDNDGRNPDVVRDAGRVLGLDIAGQFSVVVADPVVGAGLRAAATAVAAAGLRGHRHESPTGDVLVVQLPTRPSDPEKAVLGFLREVPCGVSPPVDGLAKVPHAVRLATAAARTVRPGAGGPLRLEDRWLDVFAAHSPELAAELAGRVLGPLAAVGEAERDRLLETVRTHLAGTGSIADTAAALYCHRNTVQHRFARFRELTGRDVRAPADGAVVALALSAAGLR